MRLDGEAVDLETIRQAIAFVRARMDATPGEVDPARALAAFCRWAFESVDGDHAPTGEPYRILVEYCRACGKIEGVDAEISDTVQAEATCDAEIVDLQPGPSGVTWPTRSRRHAGARCWAGTGTAAWFRGADASFGCTSTT